MKNKGEVMNTLLTEYDEEATMEYLRREAREMGREEEKTEVAKRMKQEGIAVDVIAKCTELTVEQIEKL